MPGGTVLAGQTIERPVHLCFGLFERIGVQNVDFDLSLQPDSRATFCSHGLFTTPEVTRHVMAASVKSGAGAALTHHEAHYHGVSGGIEVRAHAVVTLERGAHYLADFALAQGRGGKLDLEYTAAVGEAALAELTSRVYGHEADQVRIREGLSLDGRGSRGLVKSRVAVDDEASAEVLGETCGNSGGARGHVDCLFGARPTFHVPAKRSTAPQPRRCAGQPVDRCERLELDAARSGSSPTSP